jgi:hypothetical protein
MAQLLPFQDSMSVFTVVASAETPTAVQALAEVQESPFS